MRIIACVNQKGGSGKTTTAVNLAATLAERGQKVLLLDLDPQASATNWLGIADGGRGLLDAFAGQAQLLDLVRATPAPNLEIIGSSAWLLGVDKALAGEVAAETILRAKLRALPPRWDTILIDCAPTLGILTVSGLTAAREVLVPVEAHVMALSGLAQLLNTVAVVRERLNPELEIAGILACRVDGRTRHATEVVEQLRQRFGDLMYRTVIRENVRLAECPSFSQPITLYDPRSTGAQDYRALAEDVTARLPHYALVTSTSPSAATLPTSAHTRSDAARKTVAAASHTTDSSATGSSATGSSATGSSATGSSATGSSATGSSATGPKSPNSPRSGGERPVAGNPAATARQRATKTNNPSQTTR